MEIVEFPKWVKGVVVKNRDEEEAVLDGRAVFDVVKAASGDVVTLRSFKPKAVEKEKR